MADFHEKFMISQVGVWVKDGKVLILEDTSNPGKWVIPGGRIDRGEDVAEAFRRELKEEINMDSFDAVTVLDAYSWYAGEKDVPYCAIAYLIESDHKDIQLSPEHKQAKWIKKDEVDSFQYVWPCAARMLKKGFEVNR